jgi:predicted transcriptional regulator
VAVRPCGALERDVASPPCRRQPLNPAQVWNVLGKQLAYITVMTTLSRPHAKGAFTRQLAGRGFSYEPSGGRLARRTGSSHPVAACGCK